MTNTEVDDMGTDLKRRFDFFRQKVAIAERERNDALSARDGMHNEALLLAAKVRELETELAQTRAAKITADKAAAEAIAKCATMEGHPDVVKAKKEAKVRQIADIKKKLEELEK